MNFHLCNPPKVNTCQSRFMIWKCIQVVFWANCVRVCVCVSVSVCMYVYMRVCMYVCNCPHFSLPPKENNCFPVSALNFLSAHLGDEFGQPYCKTRQHILVSVFRIQNTTHYNTLQYNTAQYNTIVQFEGDFKSHLVHLPSIFKENQKLKNIIEAAVQMSHEH